jgi:hypothetical protein
MTVTGTYEERSQGAGAECEYDSCKFEHFWVFSSYESEGKESGLREGERSR